jgi:phosphatidylglycerophosphatase A
LALERRHLQRPDVLWASGLGLGFLPRAPGTWGSIGAVVVWWLLLAELPTDVQLGIACIYFFTGWWCSSRITNHFKVDDASEIVADEIAGMWVALALLPKLWWVALLALGLFRWLDIRKPGPIGWLDRTYKGGLGVMADDLLAGMTTATVLYFTLLALQSFGWLTL